MNGQQRLELTWIGKENQPKLEPRILIEDPEKSYGDKGTENMLIFGDNLLALKALEQDFTGKVKCIYIDPPYNTGSAFEHYDDGLEHSLWLTLMRDRLTYLSKLLSIDGLIFLQIDDNEQAYLKVLLDELFGRNNFITSIVWQKKYGSKSDSKFLSESHEYILVYAKNKEIAKINRLPRTAEQDARYKNPDNDPRGLWTSGDLLRNEARDYAIYEIIGPTGKKFLPPSGTSWRFTKERFNELVQDNRIWFGQDGSNVPRLKRFLTEVSDSVPATTLWLHTEVGHNDEAKKEIKVLFSDKNDVFATPKPERLIQRVLNLATNPGDLVLDSFLGSGTTAAVAHKLGRRWIGIELGEHCHTHCIPRLKKVCDGTDQGGISKTVNWKGGGGYKYYYLAPSLLNQDEHGNWVISKEYNPQMLAAAMAKQEGFKYCPDENCYWKQGRSTEKDYIFTTTNFITMEYIDRIHADIREDENLLICCKSYESNADKYPNITIKKIPAMLLGRCEFGKEDYSLHIVNMPIDPDAPEFVPVGDEAVNAPKSSKSKQKKNLNLFETDEDEGEDEE
ncbi:MAG TPA: site-specific DNA-methyltransferase [Bacillota bacterium]|nr:site-specific DNA-methyltransferase [Bacillota bacterium]